MRDTLYKKNISRLLACLLCLMLVITAVPALATEVENPPVAESAPVSTSFSGTCGENLQWTYQDGILTITGSGAMTNYSMDNPAPWSTWRRSIAQVSLPGGLTSIGSHSFYGCKALERIDLPDSVTAVGSYAFYDCTALSYVRLSSSLREIDESGFENCRSLTAVHLPQGLQALGFRAFARCAALQSILVPSSVSQMEMTVFAYCHSLVQADIQAPLPQLPQWTFYGCEMLTQVKLPASVERVDEYAFYQCESLDTVCYPGSADTAQALYQDIQQYLPSFPNNAVVDSAGNTVTHVQTQQSGGQVTTQTSTVTQTGNSTVSAQVTQTQGTGTEVKIDATLEDKDGWEDLTNQADGILQEHPQAPVEITVNTSDSTVDSSVLSQFAQQPVHLTVQTIGGASWTIDCATLESDDLSGSYDLSYTLEPAEAKWQEKLGGATTYLLKFKKNCTINAEFLVRLPAASDGSNAFLYQRSGSDLKHLQAALVDNSGYAHFYLANVDSQTDYFIGIDVPQADISQVIVPQNMYDEYDITDTVEKIDFVITGRKSSWGMEIGQVTWILVGVIAASVALVGGVLYTMNKRKLKKGYIPDLEAES